MRLWSEEKSGTIELLTTLPSTLNIVLGKFMYLVIYIFSSNSYISNVDYSKLSRNPDNGVITASYIGSFLWLVVIYQ